MSTFHNHLERAANCKVWMPATITKDGQLVNATQGYVTHRGADKHESNYKTRKQPTKYGQYEVEQGTFVANNHVEVDTKSLRDEKDVMLDARILRYGKFVPLSRSGNDWDKTFALAARRALEYIDSVGVPTIANSESMSVNTDSARGMEGSVL